MLDLREAEIDGARRGAAAGAAVVAPSRGEADFAGAFARLQEAVGAACAGHTEWQERIGSGVRAVLDFVAREPLAARELTGRGEAPSPSAEAVIAYFSNLLGNAAPQGRPFSVSTDQAIVESLAGVVRAHLRAGTEDRLPGMAPELTLLTLLPYSGSGAAAAATAGPATSSAAV
ncbi:MAG TPA: hypothetical protein VF234_04535 [Limnochordia bacterium]|jgi:hypothetical protein